MQNVRVIDSIMGSGKTTWFINYVKANLEQRFIYVTPYLEELNRIQKDCAEACFYQPTEELGAKMASFQMLLSEGKNIVMTHELFSRLSLSTTVKQRIEDYGYSLILDET